MKKRLLAFACVLAILAGMFVVPVSAEEAAEGTGYQVGYAKVDINPWVDLQIDENTTIGISANDASITDTLAATYIVETQIADPMDTSETITQKIIAVPFGGDEVSSRATELMDDSGDGVIGYGDGIFSTCTTVTDAYGKTVVYISIDCLRASSSMTKKIREAIVTKIGSDNISADQIMVSASHAHNAPDYDILSNVNYTNDLWQAYYDYVIDRIATATKDAFDNKSAAEMSKGSIEASAAMNTLDYGETRLNYVRHRSGTYTLKEEKSIFSYTYWSELGTDTIIRTPHSGQDFTKTVDGTKYQASFVMDEEVSEADETLHVLQFTRENGNPVLLVNWRAHATMNSSNKPALSSDYINRLRYCLENNEDQNYCVGFWQGASGNINGGRVEDEKDDTPTPWKLLNVDGLGTEDNDETNARKYGYLLSRVVLTCLNSMQDCEEGAISTRQVLYNAKRQEDDPGIIAAAGQITEAKANGESVSYPYSFNYEEDGKYYVINSSHHYEQVLTRAKRTTDIEMELNVMKLGDEVALVTLPGEPFDRYFDPTTEDTTDNDWDDLDELLGYTPFVLGYSNDAEGYLPNALSYTYAPSKDLFKQFYGTGSYESNTAKIAQGQGEALIEELGDMFEILETGYRSAVCEACSPDTEVKWTPLTQDQLGVDLTSGHYYLAEDITATTKQDKYLIGSSDSTETVCLDMNGNTLDYVGQVFYVYDGSTLNLMDSAEGGAIIAHSGAGLTGGLAQILQGGTLNLRGGTLQFIKDESYTGRHVARGGVIYNGGTLNIFDGTIIGGEIVVSGYVDADGNPLTTDGTGGAVTIAGSSATMNMSGGRIESGPSVDGVMGSCVFVTKAANSANGYHAINLTGDAYIEEIYVDGHYSNPRSISISGTYTGGFGLNLDSVNSSIALEDEVYVARVEDGADISGATLRCVNESTYTFEVSSSNANKLIMVKQIYDAVMDGVKYESLNEAITNYSGGEIQLLRDVTEDVVAENTSDVYLDLNGYDIQSVDVAEGSKLICWDFQTYDYTVEDGFGYGVIGSITGAGTVDTIPVEEDGYVMLGNDTNDDGIADQSVSFHHVNLNLTDMTLRPKSDAEDTCNPSMYYKSNFAGDEVVKENVKTFGVALSLVEVPNETNMGVTNKFSWFDGANFAAGGNNNDATSTLLYGIMNEENGRLTNSTNSTRPIYGRAYIQLNDDRYVFGASHTGTLKALTEGVDDQWEDCTSEQMEGLLTMYETYQKIMKSWDVTNISTAYEEYLDSKNEG